jgi:hypothetical protein
VAQVSIPALRTAKDTHLPHLGCCLVHFDWPASTTLSYLFFDISSTMSGRRPQSSSPFIRFRLTNPNHLCLQAIGSPKPHRPMPQVCTPSKPACRCRTPGARLAGCRMPCRYCMVWTPSLHRSMLTVLGLARVFRALPSIFQLPFSP